MPDEYVLRLEASGEVTPAQPADEAAEQPDGDEREEVER
jgi:hypothetical protein